MTVVLDSWTVLRYLEDANPAAEAVSELLGRENPLMSWIKVATDDTAEGAIAHRTVIV